MLNVGCDWFLCYRYNHFYRSCLIAIDNILRCQLNGSRYGNGAQLFKRQCADPVLPTSFQKRHHNIAFLNALCFKKVGCFIAQPLQFLKADNLLFTRVITPDHRDFIRCFTSPGIHHIICKIKIFRCVHLIVGLKIFIGIKFCSW